MEWTKREQELIEWLRGQSLSPSHGLDHLTKVAQYAADLAVKYDGKRDVVVAAVLLHDLARTETDKHGKESAERGADLARPVLVKHNYTGEETDLICRVIAEHDRPDFHSAMAESRILKDADFLDGFGVRGILRSIMYTGETGSTSPGKAGLRGVNPKVTEAVHRLGVKMRRRVEGLEFVESRRLGWKQYRFAEVFLAQLGQGQSLSEETYSGKFIVLEGISGSGKDTQAELLQKYLTGKGEKVTVVHHPTQFFKGIWRQWRVQVDDRISELFLILGDRVRVVNGEIYPALRRGDTVISTRSQVSAQVYQYHPDVPSSIYRFLFRFEPVADKLIYLDISADEALRRADERVQKGTEEDRGFFGQKQAEQLKRYQEVLNFYPNVVKVDGSGTAGEVHKRILSELHSYVAT